MSSSSNDDANILLNKPNKKSKSEAKVDPTQFLKKDNWMLMMDCIPWSKVFEFLAGDDVVKALMASKDNNPWKASGNYQQSVVPALKNRLMATERGRMELKANDQAQDPKEAFSLSKLLFSVDNKLYLRFDGLYARIEIEKGTKIPRFGSRIESQPEYRSLHLFRFYPTGEVTRAVYGTILEVEQFWNDLRKANTHRGATYQYDEWNRIGNEDKFWGATIQTGYKKPFLCHMGKDGKIIVSGKGSGTYAGSGTYTFYPCES